MDHLPQPLANVLDKVLPFIKPVADKVLQVITTINNGFEVKVNPTTIGLASLIVGLLTVAFYLHLQNTADISRDSTNMATGSNVKHNQDAPPIPPPTEIVSLRVYPIKSCRGFEVNATRLRTSGLTLDRNWMFISKEDRTFLTIRSDPSMTLIDTKLILSDSSPATSDPRADPPRDHLLEISIHGTDARVTIPAYPTRTWLESHTTLSTVEIWEQETDAWEYSDAINAIFTTFFRKPVALVYKGPTTRAVAVNGRADLYGREVAHHFADVMSVLVASEASLRDLNRRLGYAEDDERGNALTIERFRPNIIVRGRADAPWEEDTWKRIRVSTAVPDRQALYKLDLDVVARCARCQVPNVNPDTAHKDPKQPWEELMKFRRVDQGGPAKYKPCFGMLCIPKNEGVVAVGGKLEVLETTDRHLYNTRGFNEL